MYVKLKKMYINMPEDSTNVDKRCAFSSLDNTNVVMTIYMQ